LLLVEKRMATAKTMTMSGTTKNGEVMSTGRGLLVPLAYQMHWTIGSADFCVVERANSALYWNIDAAV
jgi:hypothetical protein